MLENMLASFHCKKLLCKEVYISSRGHSLWAWFIRGRMVGFFKCTVNLMVSRYRVGLGENKLDLALYQFSRRKIHVHVAHKQCMHSVITCSCIHVLSMLKTSVALKLTVSCSIILPSVFVIISSANSLFIFLITTLRQKRSRSNKDDVLLSSQVIHLDSSYTLLHVTVSRILHEAKRNTEFLLKLSS